MSGVDAFVATWIQMRWTRLPTADGDYVRIAGQPHKLQFRTLKQPPHFDMVSMEWGEWQDVVLAALLADSGSETA